MIRRIVMWFEVVVAAALVSVALWCFWVFAKYGWGHEDRYNDAGLMLLLGLLLVVGASAFTLAAAGLRLRSKWGWVAQLVPGAMVGWLVWNIVGHR